MNFWDDVAPIIVLTWLGIVTLLVAAFLTALVVFVITDRPVNEDDQIARLEQLAGYEPADDLEALYRLPARQALR